MSVCFCAGPMQNHWSCFLVQVMAMAEVKTRGGEVLWVNTCPGGWKLWPRCLAFLIHIPGSLGAFGQPNVNLRGKKSFFSGPAPLPKLDPCYLVFSDDGIRETLPAWQLPPPCWRCLEVTQLWYTGSSALGGLFLGVQIGPLPYSVGSFFFF